MQQCGGIGLRGRIGGAKPRGALKQAQGGSQRQSGTRDHGQAMKGCQIARREHGRHNMRARRLVKPPRRRAMAAKVEPRPGIARGQARQPPHAAPSLVDKAARAGTKDPLAPGERPIRPQGQRPRDCHAPGIAIAQPKGQ